MWNGRKLEDFPPPPPSPSPAVETFDIEMPWWHSILIMYSISEWNQSDQIEERMRWNVPRCAVLFNPSPPRQNLWSDISVEIARIYPVNWKTKQRRFEQNDKNFALRWIYIEQLLRLVSKRHLRIHACLNGNKANVRRIKKNEFHPS